MEIQKALQTIDQLIDVAIQRGLFKDKATVAAVIDAHASIVRYLKASAATDKGAEDSDELKMPT